MRHPCGVAFFVGRTGQVPHGGISRAVIRGMRVFPAFLLLLSLTFAVSAEPRNPFDATTPAPQAGAPPSIPKLPDVRPGPYLPLPPDTRPEGIPAPAPVPALPAPQEPTPAASLDSAAPAPGAFPTRESLEAARRRCRVSFAEKPAVLRARAQGERLQVVLRIEGASCVQALQSDQPWVDVDREGAVVSVTVAPNDTDEVRHARIFIANVGTSLSVELEQEAGR